MTIRGVHSFDNDDAVQWAQAYCEMGFDVASSTIRIALEDFSNNRLSASIAARGVAAVEALAFALGRGSPDAQRYFKSAPPADPEAAAELVDEAGELLGAIAKASELSTYWAEAGPAEHAEWVKSIEGLKSRVLGSARAPEPAPAAASVAPVAAPSPTSAAEVEDIDALAEAILMLSRDIEGLRAEMNDGFARIERRLAGLGR